MRKGFTLIELIGVIILLGVVVLIVYPTVAKNIREAKEKAYDETIHQIEVAANRYALENNIGQRATVSLIELVKSGYISKTKNGKIYNPINNQEMTGCVIIQYSDEYNQYLSEYSTTCSS